MQQNLPIVIAGPTASGKTDLALGLASLLKTDIISADSRQVYKHLTIGTAKPEGVWEGGIYKVNGIPYHLVDFLDVDQTYNAGAFCAAARGLNGIICGGTGLYIEMLFFGMNALPKDESLRAELSALPKAALYARLQGVDPVSAAVIPPGNVQRVMRALEISLLTGKPASTLRTNSYEKDFTGKAFFIYLNPPRKVLNERIVKRTEGIFDGMAREARALTRGTTALKTLGYPQALDYLDGRTTRAEAIAQITTLTRQYAKRQRTWFNRYSGVLEITDYSAYPPTRLAEVYLKKQK